MWLWLGIVDVSNVVALTEPPLDRDTPTEPETPVMLVLTEPDTALILVDTEPLGVWLANAVVNATEPPELAVPDTTRSALLSCVVDLVQPVGAEVCTNNIAVPDGNADGAAPDDAEVRRPWASTVMLEYVYDPGVTAVFARLTVFAAEPSYVVPELMDSPVPAVNALATEAAWPEVLPVPPLVVGRTPVTFVVSEQYVVEVEPVPPYVVASALANCNPVEVSCIFHADLSCENPPTYH